MQILNPITTQNTKKTEGFGFCPLDKPAKTLASLSSDNQNRHRFVVGTFEKSELNKIILLDFYEETFTFNRSILATDLPPVDHIVDFYSDPKSLRLLVSFKDLLNKGTFLALLTFDPDSETVQSGINPNNRINKTLETVRRVAVDPHSSSQSSRLSVVSKDKFYLFNNFKEEFTLQTNRDQSDKYSACFFSSRFDPHHKDVLCLTTDDFFEIFDLRQSKNKVNVRSGNHHKGTILDFNFNPNLPNELATAGEDALLLFWDLRKTSKPVSSFDTGHGHWVKRVEYNSFQDQLVLTCGAGGSFLHRRHDHFEKVSETPALCQDISWSFDDAWFYGSLLSDGLRVEMVPKLLKNTLLS